MDEGLIQFTPAHKSALTPKKQWALMFINGAHKHIRTRRPTTFDNSTTACVCYGACKWQMPVSSPPERNHHHPGGGTGEFKRSRMRLRLSSFPPQWLWHLARATFHTETSTSKPVSPGAVIYSKWTHSWSWWLSLQSTVVPCFCSTWRNSKKPAALTCYAGLIKLLCMYSFYKQECC